MSTPRVAVICPSERFDFKPAEEFGTLVVLTSKNSSPFAPDEFITAVMEGLERMNFDPTKDYVALTGPAANLAMGYAAAMVKYGAIRTLIFDARHTRYTVRMVSCKAVAA